MYMGFVVYFESTHTHCPAALKTRYSIKSVPMHYLLSITIYYKVLLSAQEWHFFLRERKKLIRISLIALKIYIVKKKGQTGFRLKAINKLTALSLSKQFLECTDFHRSTCVSHNLREGFVPEILCYAEVLQSSLLGPVRTLTVVNISHDGSWLLCWTVNL